MDWTKAKTILIAALLITNIILGISLFMVKNNMQHLDFDLEKDTRSFLASRNIYVYTAIPEKVKPMPVLDVRYDNYSTARIQQLLENATVKFTKEMSQEEIAKQVETFLKENGLFNEYAQLETINEQENGYIITFKNYYNDIPLEDSFIKCVIENGYITNIDLLLLTPIKGGSNKKDILSATTALIKFAGLAETIDKPVNVTNIELVYWLQDRLLFDIEDTTSDTVFPAWCITYNEEKICIYAYEE